LKKEILVLGTSQQIQEFKSRVQTNEEIIFDNARSYNSTQLRQFDVIFDFLFDEDIEVLEDYVENTGQVVFVNSVKTTLGEIRLFLDNPKAEFIGMNGLPTFLNKEHWEIVNKIKNHKQLQSILTSLGLSYYLVEDRVGMVAARVICMIINEAYYTLMEGVANKSDIDTSMKLGTNYPYGPFEWCKTIGIQHIYDLLDALHNDTKDPRYMVCPLLKQEYLASFGTSFIPQ